MAQGDFYVLSVELAPTSPGPETLLSFVAPRDSAICGGERGVLRQTGVEDLNEDGGADAATVMGLPLGPFRAATRSTTHRVPIIAGHVLGQRRR